MKIFNWHIIHDRELKQIRETDLKLKRKFSPKQIEDILEGRCHIHLNPRKKIVQALRPTINGEVAA